MQYRLGEYECDACGHRASGHSDDQEDVLPTRRVSSTPGYAPAKSVGYVDPDVQRGTRRH
jgi:hypothetical protein